MKRLERHLRRAERIWVGEVSTTSTIEDMEDVIRPFFCDCWHMREYLVQSDPKLFSLASVNACVAGSVAIRVCADVCNGIKHVVRDRPPSSGSERNLRTNGNVLIINDGAGGWVPPSTHGIRFVIEPDSLNGLDIMKTAIADWKALINAAGVSPSP